MQYSQIQPEVWLPPGKLAAVCFSIDDVHPGRASDDYDAGGDLDAGVLGLVRQLLEAHAGLRLTLFVTPDWRETTPTPSKVLSKIPVLSERIHLTRLLPKGTRSLVRHPAFVRYLKSLPRTDVQLHGLHHVHTGRLAHVEFQDESAGQCRGTLEEAKSIFREAGLAVPVGMCPPGWHAPEGLLRAMDDLGFEYVASARDILTSVADDALANMSGLKGVPLMQPARVGQRLLHFTSNFQATSTPARARAIIERGGLLAVKAHIIKNAMGHIALDGVDALYCNYLNLLFSSLEREYGDALWWTSFDEVSRRIHENWVGDQRAEGA